MTAGAGDGSAEEDPWVGASGLCFFSEETAGSSRGLLSPLRNELQVFVLPGFLFHLQLLIVLLC